jgi:hypothetical protein
VQSTRRGHQEMRAPGFLQGLISWSQSRVSFPGPLSNWPFIQRLKECKWRKGAVLARVELLVPTLPGCTEMSEAEMR